MARSATPPAGSPPPADPVPLEEPQVVGIPDPADYVPLSGAIKALRGLHGDPEFRKTPAAVEVAYALGAMEEDVYGSLARSAYDDAHRGDALNRVLQLVPVIAQVMEAYIKLFRHDDNLGVVYPEPPAAGYPYGSLWAGDSPGEHLREVYEREGCQPVPLPGLSDVASGWGCCVCFKHEGTAAYNGNQRAVCRVCAHPRCGAAADPPAPAA